MRSSVLSLQQHDEDDENDEVLTDEMIKLTRNDFFARFNFFFKLLKQFVDQTVFISGLINIDSKDPFPTPTAVFWGMLAATFICLAETRFHMLIDTLEQPKLPGSQGDQPTLALMRTPVSTFEQYKHKLALCGHVLNDVLDGAGFVSVIHAGFSFYVGHEILLAESISLKVVGTLVGMGSTVHDTRVFIAMLKWHDLWDADPKAKKKSATKATETTALLSPISSQI